MINTPKKGIHRFAKSDSFDEADVSEEVARVLFINEDYTIKRMKFLSLAQVCFDKLWLTKWSKQLRVMKHYFNNGACYIMRSDNFTQASEEEIDECWKNNQLFMSVVQRINHLDTEQKKRFLASMEHHHDTDQTVPTPNPIVVMDTILSSILTIK